MELKVVKEDITQLEKEAIVNPANSQLRMGGGLAGIIKEKGGKEIEKEGQKQAPVKVGEAIITTAGRLPSKYVIHAPTMKTPAKNVPAENAKKATKGILNCANKNNIKEVAIPGLGTGVGGVSPEDAAEKMIEAINEHEGGNPQEIILVGYGQELYEAFKKEKNYSE